MPKTNIGPHPFTIKDEDLFPDESRTTTSVLTLKCAVCDDQPGQGVHVPPPPPTHKVIIGEVAKTLAGIIDEPHDSLRFEAARAAFTTIQQVRTLLEEMGKRETYSDPHDMGDPFGDIDTALDELLTELRKAGWVR